MKRATNLILLCALFIVVWPAQGQTPTTAADYVNRGDARQAKSDLDGAIADFSKAIEIEPRYAYAYINRGNARQAKGDLEGAIADYTKAIEIDPQYAKTYFNRGAAQQAKGDLEGAIADYTKAIEIDPRDAKAYNNRGILRKAKSDLDGAIADYTKAIELDPGKANAYLNRGIARKVKGDLEGAIADYTKAIEIDPINAGAYNSLAWLLATSARDSVRDGKKAVEYATKAAELSNWQIPNYLGTLAAAYAETDNFDEAINWQNKALSFPEYEKKGGEAARQRLQLYTGHKPYREK
jgi:tetratricopeptide (TPR) repeat protein